MTTRAATVLPPFPYEPGTTFVIKAHTPPPPFGPSYKNEDPVRIPVRGLAYESGNRVDHMGFVISNPPLDPPTTASTRAKPQRDLTIVHKVNHKPKEDGGGPIVVRCSLDADESTTYIAKIYDGFEYALAEPGESGCDCMYLADMHYSREAAAYESIPSRFQGSIVPRYFGSWTFPLPTGAHGRRRWVRMVLMEDVPGECMLDIILRAKGATRSNPDPDTSLDYNLLPPEQERLDIMARIVEAESDIRWDGGVIHGDVEPRNIIISRPGRSNGPSRVTIIDFNLAYVLQRCEAGRQMIAKKGYGKGLPPSIIERHWFGSKFAYGSEYSEWIPQSWVVAEEPFVPAARWLVERWIGSPKFQPLSDEFLNDSSHEYLEEPLRQVIEEVKTFVAKDRRARG
jgi:serine/threonine protein kinase